MNKLSLQRKKTLEKMQNLFFRSGSSEKHTKSERIRDGDISPEGYAEAIIEAVHQPLVILDTSLTFRSVNKAFCKTFKTLKKETIGQNLSELGKQDKQFAELAKRLEALTKNKSFEEFEMTINCREMEEQTLVINAKRILLGKYTTDFILLGIEDITKRKMIDKQKDDFIGYVTHELKTPITTITAFIQILQAYHAKTKDKKSQFLLAKVASQMERLTGLLNSFANVYKAQTGQLEIQKQKLDIDRLVHDVVEAFQYTTTTHDLIIKGKITKPIMADKERIHEVLINLIINAIKYSPHANKIIIELTEKEKEVVISVKDFGFGITIDEQKKVFERFFRVKSKKDNKVEGLGLGLYLVSEIIRKHKGNIWVKSVVGKGSTFSFSLPIN